MSTKVALGEDENTCCSVRFKLMKSLGHYSEPTPFSDSSHYSFEMFTFGNPYTFYVSNKMKKSHYLILRIFLLR